jgi:glycosyltransferase involved in cell wall biosynthesis
LLVSITKTGNTKNVEMKILHVINTLGKGGAEKLLVQTLPRYKQAGLDVELLQITAQHSVPEYLETLKQQGVVIHTLGNKSVYSLANIGLLKNFFSNRLYDLVHVHIFPAMYWVPIAIGSGRKGMKLVFTEHNTQNRRWDKWYFKAIDKFIYQKYKAIVAITNDVKTNLAKWQPGVKDRIVTIFNGIDIATLNEVKAANRQTTLQNLNIPYNAVLLLMTARFDRQKNHRTIIECMEQLPPEYYLLLAGDGPERANMEALAAADGVVDRVKFLGFRADVLSLMKMVDINILSSNYEGLSGVTLEALCSGKPFLGSDVTGIQNVVPDKRFLFENNNVAALASAVQHISNDAALASAMVATSQNYVTAYDINKMVSEHIELYNALQKN